MVWWSGFLEAIGLQGVAPLLLVHQCTSGPVAQATSQPIITATRHCWAAHFCTCWPTHSTMRFTYSKISHPKIRTGLLLVSGDLGGKGAKCPWWWSGGPVVRWPGTPPRAAYGTCHWFMSGGLVVWWPGTLPRAVCSPCQIRATADAPWCTGTLVH